MSVPNLLGHVTVRLRRLHGVVPAIFSEANVSGRVKAANKERNNAQFVKGYMHIRITAHGHINHF
jgi:hypothetical protein